MGNGSTVAKEEQMSSLVPEVTAGEAAEKALVVLVKMLDDPDRAIRLQAASLLLGHSHK